MKTKLLLFTFLLTSIHFYAQQRTCGMETLMQQKLQDPTYRAQHQQQQELFNLELQKIQSGNIQRMATLTIPVAVHFPAGNPADRTCLEAFAQNQIDILNNDYTGTNADISNWTAASTFYPGVTTGVIDVEFVIANQNHPVSSGLIDGDKAVTIGYNFGGGNDSDPVWAGYMNFVIKDIGAGLLGYSPLGGIPNNGAAVVMNTFAFASGAGCTGYVPGAPYDLGRTVTHELGHFFNLNHPWADGTCTGDDGVADTPNIDAATYSCPADGSVTMCGNTSLTMNYMDYVNDACMYLFTNGQASRATAYINSIYSQYKNNTVLSVASENFNTQFTIYPNPVKNTFSIQTKSNLLEDNAQLIIFDILGKQIKVIKLNPSLSKHSINVSNLHQGLYIIKIISGKNQTSKKLIIQ